MLSKMSLCLPDTMLVQYEKHLESTGQKPSHEFFKEMAAGVAAGEVDKLAETKVRQLWLATSLLI